MSETLERAYEELRSDYRDAVLTIGILLDKLGGKVEISKREIVDFDASRRISRYPTDDQNGIVLAVEPA